MELLTADRRFLDTEAFRQHIDPFPQANGYNLVYDHQQPASVIHSTEHNVDNDASMIIASNQAPPQKLRPIRCSVRSPVEDPPSSAVGGVHGALDKLPELEFFGDQVCAVDGETGGRYFACSMRAGAVDVADNNYGCHGFEEEDPNHVGSGACEQDRGPSFVGANCSGYLTLSSSDSDANSSEGVEEPSRGKRKRKTRKKVELFLEHIVSNVMEKQEQMHNQLIEMIEKREKARIIREEAWKQQEIERTKKDEEARTQEISRSLALISFIQNVLGHEVEFPHPLTTSAALSSCVDENGGKTASEVQIRKEMKSDDPFINNNNRRWPEAEVQSLIMLRTGLDNKFRVVVAPKSSIWDEISVGMCSMGYNRSAKKCKEKWENINKYFRKTMGSGKKQSENSKTRSYFQELDMLYKNGVVIPGNQLVVEPETKSEPQ